ncbi:MAG: diguanylate cyclase, partial [candidate division NC10 bacterium]|nr:diguanylate cyclase [candidate division NC10 bacterium]
MSRKVERHMSLRTRFTIGMGAMLLPLVLSVAAILFSHQNLSASLHDTVEEVVEEIHPVVHLQMLILQAAMPVNDYLIHGHTDERENFARLSREVDSAFQEALAGPFALSEERAAIESARVEWERGRALGEAILALPRPVGNPDAAGEMMERFDACINRAVTLLEQVHDLAEGELEEVLARTEAARQELWLVTASLLIVGLGMAVAAATALAHSVLAPVHALSTGAVRFGEGDLSHRVILNRQDELGQLAGAFNRMADQLEQSQAALKELAIHDSLTGLYNRREFERWLKEEAERSRRFGRPFALLMLDIDHFKVVNDT